jgi:hypothetical protein
MVCISQLVRYQGSVFRAGGIATHESLSPYDRHAVIVAEGPSFISGIVSPVQTSAVDIAPTILESFGIASAKIESRVFAEGLHEGPGPRKVQLETFRIESEPNPGLKFTRVHGVTNFEGVS